MVLLSADAINLQYGGLHAIKNVALNVEEGELHCIIGPNGAGKTSLFNVITGASTPQSGELRLADTSIMHLGQRARVRAGLVRTYQTTRIFPTLTVLEHVRLAQLMRRRQPCSCVDTHAEATLAAIGLLGRRSARAQELPHGDKRRLMIALCLVLDPLVLLLDEPTQGMGAAEAQRTISFLQQIRLSNPKLAILMIEHDVPLVTQIADRITVLDHGAVLASGDTGVIIHNEKVREAYFGHKGASTRR